MSVDVSDPTAYRRVIYRDATGMEHQAKWPLHVEPTRRAIFRGDEYQLAGIADGVIRYTRRKPEDS